MGFIFLIRCALAIASLVASSASRQEQGPSTLNPRAAATLSARVDRLLTKNPLIDGHDDLAIVIRFLNNNSINTPSFTTPFERTGLLAQVDLPRLKTGKVGGAFWSAFIPCPANATDFSNANYAPTVQATYEQLDVLQRLMEAYPDIFDSRRFNASTAVKTFKGGRLISPFAVEGLHQIGNSLANLREMFALNAQYFTLTWNCRGSSVMRSYREHADMVVDNVYADAALLVGPGGASIAAPPHWGGVSPRGQILIKEMNRMGAIVDLAHVSKNTMVDVLGGRPGKWEGSLAPVIFSHSSAFALCPHPRNVPDDVLELVKRTNSLVMVNFTPDFISCTLPLNKTSGLPEFFEGNSTVHQAARHVMYIGEKIGWSHVGLGSDFDGMLAGPRGLEDVSKFPNLVAELFAMGLRDEDAPKVVGGNVLRVAEDVAKVAAKMQSEGVLPAEDVIDGPRSLTSL